MSVIIVSMLLKILVPVYTWLPTIFFWGAFISASAAYIWRSKLSLARWSKILIAVTAFYYLAYAAVATALQYYSWKGNALAAKLLASPISSNAQDATFWGKFPAIANSKLGYFVFYSWSHFWFDALLAILGGVVFWIILRSLKKYKERFFEDGEVELGTLTAMMAGWPQFVAFVPFVFIAVVVISIIRMAFFKEAYTTLGIPMLLAVLATYIFSTELAWLLIKLNP